MVARPSSPARRALFIYAGVTAVIGAYLILWGPTWLPVSAGQSAESFVPAAIVRIVGGVLIVFASAGVALARALDGFALSRGIGWFAFGHGIFWIVLIGEREAIFGSTIAVNLAVGVVLVLFAGLMYVREAEESRLKKPGGKTAAALASQSLYDQAIREAASQEERHRLARDLHDSIKQQIFAVQTAAATVEARIDGDRSGAVEAIALVRSSAREAMTEMEAMLDQLRATALDNAGLTAALRKQCDALEFRTGAMVSFTVGTLPADDAIGPGVRPALLRIAQEALANVARHARAHKVSVTLESSRGGLNLLIADDGSGFDPQAAAAGMGLRNMRSRAADVGGELIVGSAPGTGTVVRALMRPADLEPMETVDRWKPWNNNVVIWVGTFLMMQWNNRYAWFVWGAFAIWIFVRELPAQRRKRRQTT